MTTNPGLISTSLTKEQRKKFKIEEEILDRRGVIRRFRVADQTIFDALLCAEIIVRNQHEAAEHFMETVEKTGCYPSSISVFESTSNLPSYAVGRALSQRWLAFSGVYEYLNKCCGKRSANYMIKMMDNLYSWRERFGTKDLVKVGERVSKPLEVLAEYYNCVEKDPRTIIRTLTSKQ
jgi:hypothetical protein